MQKLLKPFARENAFLLVDPARNVLSLAGTPEELANYQDTIDTFDVDWLKGMSVGVFGLQRARWPKLMPELQKMFGPDSGMPLAGMVRFSADGADQLGGGDFVAAAVPQRSRRLDPHHRRRRRQRAADVCV